MAWCLGSDSPHLTPHYNNRTKTKNFSCGYLDTFLISLKMIIFPSIVTFFHNFVVFSLPPLLAELGSTKTVYNCLWTTLTTAVDSRNFDWTQERLKIISFSRNHLKLTQNGRAWGHELHCSGLCCRSRQFENYEWIQ